MAEKQHMLSSWTTNKITTHPELRQYPLSTKDTPESAGWFNVTFDSDLPIRQGYFLRSFILFDTRLKIEPIGSRIVIVGRQGYVCRKQEISQAILVGNFFIPTPILGILNVFHLILVFIDNVSIPVTSKLDGNFSTVVPQFHILVIARIARKAVRQRPLRIVQRSVCLFRNGGG